MSVRDFKIKIGGMVDPSLNKSFSQGSKELKKLNSEMINLKKHGRNLNKLKTNHEKLEQQFSGGNLKIKENYKSLKTLNDSVKAYQQAIANTNKPTKQQRDLLKNTIKARDKLKKSIRTERKALLDMSHQLKEARRDTKNLSKEQEGLASSMKKVEERQKKLNEQQIKYQKRQKLKSSVSDKAEGVALRSAGQAVTLGVAVKFAIDDEEAFADVRKTTGLKGKEADEFKKKLKEATKDIPKFNSEIYEIAAAAGQAGINLKEIPKFAADTAKVSVAFDMEAGDAGDKLATWRESFKMSQKEVMVLADQMNYLGDNIKVMPAQLADITTAVGPLGKMANFTEAQTSALGGTLVALGVKDSSTASTALRKLYGTLASGEAATSSVSSAFQKLGLDAVEVAQNLQKDSEGTLIKVFKSLNELDKAEQLSVTKELFGEEALSSMGMLISNTKFLEENLKLVGAAGQYSGSVMDEYNNKLDTTATDLKLVGKSLVTSAGTLTRVFLPPIRSGAKAIQRMSDGIGKFSEDWPKLSKTLAFGAAGFVGLKLGVSGAVLSIKQLSKTKEDLEFLKDTFKLVKGTDLKAGVSKGIEGFKILKKAGISSFKGIGEAAKVTGSIGVKTFKVIGNIGLTTFKALGSGVATLGKAGMTFLFSPWGAAFAAVALGGYLVYKNWDKVKGGFKSTYDFIKGGLAKLWELWKKFTIPGRIFSWGMEKYKQSKLKNAGKETAEVPAYAKGGVVRTPHLALVGDGRTPESIIPHDGTRRSKNLWYEAGERLGMFIKGKTPGITRDKKSSSISYNSNPGLKVNVEVNNYITSGQSDLKEIIKNIPSELEVLIRKVVTEYFEKKIKTDRRLSFG